MVRIAVLGGTGYGGEAVVREAARRGHAVTSYSRNPPSEPVEGVEYVTGSLLDPAQLARTVEDTDVVFETLSPRGDLAGQLEGVVERLIGGAAPRAYGWVCSAGCRRSTSPRAARAIST